MLCIDFRFFHFHMEFNKVVLLASMKKGELVKNLYIFNRLNYKEENEERMEISRLRSTTPREELEHNYDSQN